MEVPWLPVAHQVLIAEPGLAKAHHLQERTSIHSVPSQQQLLKFVLGDIV